MNRPALLCVYSVCVCTCTVYAYVCVCTKCMKVHWPVSVDGTFLRLQFKAFCVFPQCVLELALLYELIPLLLQSREAQLRSPRCNRHTGHRVTARVDPAQRRCLSILIHQRRFYTCHVLDLRDCSYSTMRVQGAICDDTVNGHSHWQ